MSHGVPSTNIPVRQVSLGMTACKCEGERTNVWIHAPMRVINKSNMRPPSLDNLRPAKVDRLHRRRCVRARRGKTQCAILIQLEINKRVGFRFYIEKRNGTHFR